MSSVALMWASTVAPVADVQEYAVLVRMADEADEAGCGVLLATRTIAADVLVNEKTVQRRLDAMQERGLIGLGDQRKAEYIRADRRPVVYDLLIPAACFADLGRTNARRAAKDLPPLTPENRPVQAPPPADKQRTPRSDIGKPRAKKLVEGGDDAPTGHATGDGGTTSPPDNSGTGGLVVRHGGTSSPARGDYQSPDPGVLNPGSSNPGITPPVRTSVTTAHARDETATGGDLDEETRKELNAACSAASAVRGNSPGWAQRQIGEAVKAALDAGHAPAAVVARLAQLAADDGTAYPTRLRHVLDLEAAQLAAAVAPAGPAPSGGGLEGPFRYLANDRPRCRSHPGHPANNCGPCRVDARVSAAETAEAGPATPDPVPAGQEARAAAGRIAAQAKSAARAVRERGRRPATPDPTPAPVPTSDPTPAPAPDPEPEPVAV